MFTAPEVGSYKRRISERIVLFAGAAGADQGMGFARLNVQSQIANGICECVRVTERYVFKINPTSCRRQLAAFGASCTVGLVVEESENRRCRGD